eukprot:CAMPEP_0172361556 /NCGR_PEP_ID=MMETSP1060-20121228/5364_1 /TAXON_ID=37318 /ORGANISM="Pseudo-nitzschia pungens, Strain cf. cingulata" /LENGTH=767 /DNA_ID=CAMNT_0013083845 /DNA_START=46 /DNA_END=2349 /DNA_ORIENTATION=-
MSPSHNFHENTGKRSCYNRNNWNSDHYDGNRAVDDPQINEDYHNRFRGDRLKRRKIRYDYGANYSIASKWFSISLLLVSLYLSLQIAFLHRVDAPSQKQTAKQSESSVPLDPHGRRSPNNHRSRRSTHSHSAPRNNVYVSKQRRRRMKKEDSVDEIDLSEAPEFQQEVTTSSARSEETRDNATESAFVTYSSALDPNKFWLDDLDINSFASPGDRLRVTLLTGYEKNSFPFEWAWTQNFESGTYDRIGDKLKTRVDPQFQNVGGTNGTSASSFHKTREGLPVEIGLNVHKVYSVDVAASTVDLLAWLSLAWYDPRLAWNPEDFGGLNCTWFFVGDGIGGGEASEIWTPDIYLWNSADPIASTLDNAYIKVTNDGRAFWVRPGRIVSTCKYKGLEKFPFDRLACQLEFGSWVYSGMYLHPTTLKSGDEDHGLTIGGSETSGSSFATFQINTELSKSESIVYPPYPVSPDEDWPVLIYDLYFDRASAPYVRGVLFINVLLNLAAFLCFWIPPHVGERMGLAITCVLAAVAGELVVAGLLPVCREVTWYNKFMILSTSFAMIVVFESTVVIYFFYFTGDDLVPTWVRYLQRRCQCKARPARTSQAQANSDMERSNTAEDHHATDVDWNPSSDDGSKDNHHATDADWNPSSSDGSQDSIIVHSFSNIEPNENDETGRRSMFAGSKHASDQRAARALSLHEAGDFRTEEEAENNLYWQAISEYIDDGARILLPIFYVVVVGFLYKARDQTQGTEFDTNMPSELVPLEDEMEI